MIDDASERQDGPRPKAVSFGARLAGSEAFKALFRDGMGLVEETASYLDGNGRASARSLSRAGSLAYATESMRLTTRLMQLASWLLLQRAVQDGELTRDQAATEKSKVRLDQLSSPRDGPGIDELPAKLTELIERSVRLQERVRRFDAALTEVPGGATEPNPVAREIERLSAALGARGPAR